ncbi:MAG: Rpn family recombination-promoting nuclease/putative transposase [Lachnospiraceae bacterium]|nr:Rpn family recombination-promoting nuclease/putative transposase [Lachnospiraceae bacterium]
MNKNKLLLRLFSDKERYADLINGYSGAQVIRAEDLLELDSISHVFPSYGEERHSYHSNEKTEDKKKKDTKERSRDLICKSAYGLNFAIIGIENQSEVHYLMPLRTMSYDVAEYEKQAYLTRQKVKGKKNLSPGEFLSGFRKTDRLHPCITLVLFWGDKWDGPTDLYDLLDFEDIPPALKKMVNNYPLHIIDVNTFENTDAFETDLKQIFNFIRNSRNGMKLKELLNSDSAYHAMDEIAYDVITAFTHATELANRKLEPNEGGKIDMCEGIKQLIEEGKNEGISEGISIGQNSAFDIIRQLKDGVSSEDLISQGYDKDLVQQALTLV